MEAIANPGGDKLQYAEVMEVPEPEFDGKSVLVKTKWIGLCATDVPYLEGSKDSRVDKSKPLIGFHEVVGEIVARGDRALPIPIGTWVIPLVRRCQQWVNGTFVPCRYIGDCPQSGHPDRCPRTDKFRYISRGTGKLDGFASQWFADDPQWLITIPKEVQDELDYLCVLAEPMSIAQKAARLAYSLRRAVADNPSPFTDRVLVAGLGPIGLLAGFILRLQYGYVNIFGADIYERDNIRAELWQESPGKGLGLMDKYIQVEVEDKNDKKFFTEWSEENGKFQLIIEATGIPEVISDLVGALAPDGVLVVLGIPEDTGNFIISGKQLGEIVARNRVIAGCVNADRRDFIEGLYCLAAHHKTCKSMLESLAPQPTYNYKQYTRQWLGNRLQNKANEIKVILKF